MCVGKIMGTKILSNQTEQSVSLNATMCYHNVIQIKEIGSVLNLSRNPKTCIVKLRSFVICAAIVLILFCIEALVNREDLFGKAEALEPVTIERVIDGDTLLIRNADNQEIRIRMIGVNTPESVSPDPEKNSAAGDEASAYTKAALPVGMTVYLEYDLERNDRYGRTLAYVWLSDQCDRGSYRDFCQYNYGAVLLKNTPCEAMYYAPNRKYREWYEKLEVKEKLK